MSRSRLYKHRRAIAEALGRGDSVRTVALRYGVDYTTASTFIARWLPEHATEGALRKVEYNRARQAERYEIVRAYRAQQRVSA